MIVREYLSPNKGRVEDILEFQLIVRKVRFMQVRALLHNYNLKSCEGEFLGHHATSATCSHNDEIHCSFVLEFSHCGHSLMLVLFGVIVAKRWLVNHLVPKADQLPSGIVLVTPIFGPGKKSHNRMQSHKLEKFRMLDCG